MLATTLIQSGWLHMSAEAQQTQCEGGHSKVLLGNFVDVSPWHIRNTPKQHFEWSPSALIIYTLQRITIVQQSYQDQFGQTPKTEQNFDRITCSLSQVVRINLMNLLLGRLLCGNSSLKAQTVS